MVIAMTQGWTGVELAYAAVQIPMLVGLVRNQGPWQRYLASPLVAAPLTAIVGAGMWVAGPALSLIGATPHGLIHTALAASISMVLGYSGGESLAKEETQERVHQRGAVVSKTDKTAGAARTRRRERSVQIHALAGREVAPSDETKHFKLIGTTGTGKSTAIREILDTALARGDRAVIADPDGGYMRRFYEPARGDVVLNPFDERLPSSGICSPKSRPCLRRGSAGPLADPG